MLPATAVEGGSGGMSKGVADVGGVGKWFLAPQGRGGAGKVKREWTTVLGGRPLG
jgi:hypothetical protein